MRVNSILRFSSRDSLSPLSSFLSLSCLTSPRLPPLDNSIFPEIPTSLCVSVAASACYLLPPTLVETRASHMQHISE